MGTWDGNVNGKGTLRMSSKFLSGNALKTAPWEDRGDIRITLRWLRCEDVRLMELGHERVQWRALAPAVLTFLQADVGAWPY
jgi:hypothetical protein